MIEEFYQEFADKFIFKVKKGFLYTENDVWAKIRDNEVQIGVTDFLQKLSGDATFIELPQKGKTVKQGEEIASYETIKAVVSIIAPLDGVVIEVNSILNDKPELINEDPYDTGWLVIVSPTHLEKDKLQLLTAEKYFEIMKLKIKDEVWKSKKEV